MSQSATKAQQRALAEVAGLEGTRAIMERAAKLHDMALATHKSLRRPELDVWRAVEALGVQSLDIQQIKRPQGSPLLWPSGFYISHNPRTFVCWEVRILIEGHGARDFRHFEKRERMMQDIAHLHLKYDLPVFEITS